MRGQHPTAAEERQIRQTASAIERRSEAYSVEIDEEKIVSIGGGSRDDVAVVQIAVIDTRSVQFREKAAQSVAERLPLWRGAGLATKQARALLVP